MILKKNKQLSIINYQLSNIKHTIARNSFFKTIALLLLIVNCSLIIVSCKVYSFTGTTLSPDLKTINLQNVLMGTAGGPANMAAQFTEKLKDYYVKNTSLKLKSTDSDLVLETTIVGYEITPVSVTSGDKAAANRLTIRVEVHFTNNKKEDDSFDKEFSFYKDFPQEQTLTQVESTYVPKIIEQIVQDIFNATAAQW